MSLADDLRRVWRCGSRPPPDSRPPRTASGSPSSPPGLTVPSRLSSPRSRYSTVHLVFDICQGIGIAAAVGMRPFLPALAVGALGAADAQIDFSHTSYSFLEQGPFLLVMLIGVVLLGATERRATRSMLEGRAVTIILAVVSLIVGALFFAGALAQAHHGVWPGYIGGVICAGIALLATRPLLERVRARLDDQTAAMLPLFSESGALA